MTEDPIIPPPELVQYWCHTAETDHKPDVAYSLVSILATRAAQWGADQELEACCKWLAENMGFNSAYSKEFFATFRAARRLKPPSLKEQALTALHAIATGANDTRGQHQDFDTIRRALEQLDD